MASSSGNDDVPPISTAAPAALSEPQASHASQTAEEAASPTAPQSPRTRLRRTSTATSVVSEASSRLRAASLKLLDADVPTGMWAATGSTAARAPSLSDIRRGSFDRGGWTEHAHRDRRTSAGSFDAQRPVLSKGSPEAFAGRGSSPAVASNTALEPFPVLAEEEITASSADIAAAPAVEGEKAMSANDTKKSEQMGSGSSEKKDSSITKTETTRTDGADGADDTRPPPYPYEMPPPLPWTTSTLIGLLAFWHWFLTIPGFLITVYGLNVVAWGGMLFLLLCNASPAMCHPSCNDINSPRRIWIEIDSQILNALFCVTGFGLAPWRFRDLYWWCWWRLGRSEHAKSTGIRRLAGVHKGWFRLRGSDALPVGVALKADDPAVPEPLRKAPAPPLTNVRAPPTAPWKMDFVVLMMAANTFLQACLCGFMWGRNRYNRPSWATGLFVALACVVAGMAGFVMFQEGKNVKKVEGAPISREERKARGWPLEDEETGALVEHSTAANGGAGMPAAGKEKAARKEEERRPASLQKGKDGFS
jgi:hypothetical protein